MATGCADEAERLAALASYELCGTGPEEVFDELVKLASRVSGACFSGITLIDADTAWFKAVHGEERRAAPRGEIVCNALLTQRSEVMVLPDLADDPRFAASSLVQDEGFRSYAGVALVNPEGHRLGSLCVLDRSARTFRPETIETLQTLARAVTANLELRRALRRADLAAQTDALTGLLNRRTAVSAIEALGRTRTKMTAIAIDLDFFKEVNDSAGHEAGDLLLQETARRLRGILRESDIVARWGGDEFLVLMPDVADKEAVAVIAGRISARLHAPVRRGEEMIRLGATIGIARFPADVSDPAALIRVADQALLRAKQDKRGSIGWAMREDFSKVAAATTIVRAFENDVAASGRVDHAWAALQPIVTLPRLGVPQRLLAVEVLARWAHPQLGTIPPNELFPVLGPERAQVLTEAVLRDALFTYSELREGLDGARLSVNLSAGEVMRPETAGWLTELVQRAGLSLTDIELEITEEVLLERVSDRALEQLARLRGLGARLVLDDFGTGNSGLSQLLRLPLDGLKLDKQFVQRLGSDPRADEIVRATAFLAKGLKLDMVAEGVETPEQAARLEHLGFRAVQGFLFGRPMGSGALAEWLDTRKTERGRLHFHPLRA